MTFELHTCPHCDESNLYEIPQAIVNDHDVICQDCGMIFYIDITR